MACWPNPVSPDASGSIDGDVDGDDVGLPVDGDGVGASVSALHHTRSSAGGRSACAISSSVPSVPK